MHSFLLNILIQFLPNLRFISLKKSQINIDFTIGLRYHYFGKVLKPIHRI